MSKLQEYLNLIPKGIKNIDKVIEGNINAVKLEWGHLPQNEQDEIIRRRIICSSCPFNSTNAKTSEEYKELYGEHYETERTDLHCSHCGCPISTKSSSLNSDCGITSWNEKHIHQQELKWTKYINQ